MVKVSNRLQVALVVILILGLPLAATCSSATNPASASMPETTVGQPSKLANAAKPAGIAKPASVADLKSYRNPDFPLGYRNPLPHLPVPQHPFLAPNGKSNMHNDAYMSDTYEVSGPLGLNPQVTLSRYAKTSNQCVTITFDRKGRIITVNARPGGYHILLLDPNTLKELASYPLPPRHKEDPLFPFNDTSGGAYFVLDHQDRVLVATSENIVQIIKYVDEQNAFQLVRKYDLADHVVPMKPPAMDHVQMALPDWEGRLWFVTRYGKVGTIDPESGETNTIELAGEEMQNSFTVGEDGVYIITDHAMYRFHADKKGLPVTDWRTEYDRGARVKPSMINQGSGTTPQLFGDLVAIGDNAEPRMNILFLRRSDGVEVCRIPVFEDGLSTTENCLPGFARKGANGIEYSVIVENNYGKLSGNIVKPGGCCAESVGGVTRIDVIPDGSGGYTCKEVWTSPENSCSPVPKLSLKNGLVYLYIYEPGSDYNYAWYFTAVDFKTGRTVFRVPTGRGVAYTDFGSPITLDPDGGIAYIGTTGGLVSIRDVVH